MDNMTYRQELQQVCYTDAGRAALVEQLMAEQAAEQPAAKGRWGRKGFMAVLAAVLLVTAAAAATAPVWLSFFGGLDKGQQEVVGNLETPEDALPPAAEGGGVTITPLNILGSQNKLYVILRIQAPEGTAFTAEDGMYEFSASVSPKEAPAEKLASTSRFTALEAGTEAPNVLTGVFEISTFYNLGGGTLQIRELGRWTDGEDTYRKIFEGEWNIPLPEGLTGNQVLEPPVEGVSVETEHGTFTLDSICVSPLGILWQYQFDGRNEPVVYVALKMKDGSMVEPSPGQLILGYPGVSETATVSFVKPVDLSQAVALYWGGVEIPLDGQGETAVVESVPITSDEPPFSDQPAGGEGTGESEPAAQPEKSGGTGADSGPAPSAGQPDPDSKTVLRNTDTGLTITTQAGGDEELSELWQQRDDYYLRTLSLSDCEMIYNEPVTDRFVYKRELFDDEVCFGIDYLTFAEDGYSRAAYWSHREETCMLAVYRDENGDTWGRAFRVPEELVWPED